MIGDLPVPSGYLQVVGPTYSGGECVRLWPEGVEPVFPWCQPVYAPDLRNVPLEELLAKIRRRAGGDPATVTTTADWRSGCGNQI